MERQKYELWIGETKIASEMEIDDALVLVKALYEKYYMETDMEITIKPMARCEVKENEDE
jgi:hypothetical protein